MSLKQPDYSRFSEYYDLVELGGGQGPVNFRLLEKILRKNKVSTVLDFTCGTGAQSIPLSKKGYRVTAADFNRNMLEVAKRKALKDGLKIDFCWGDIRKSRLGKFDAVIAMFNSVAHLNRQDFERALINVGRCLKGPKLFVFDVFNLEYMRQGGFIDNRFIDVATEKGGTRFVRFNKNRINFKTGLLTVNQETFIQKGLSTPERYMETYQLQTYTKQQIREVLEKNGFEVARFYDVHVNKGISNEGLFLMASARQHLQHI